MAQPFQPRAPDAPARDAVPRRGALLGRHPPGRAGWKDTVGVLPNETVTVQPWFIPYAGRDVFHCHSLEHGDKAMMLQLEVVSEARRSSRRVALVAAARRRRRSPRRRSPAWTRSRGTRPRSSIEPGHSVRWTFPGTTQDPQRLVGRRARPAQLRSPLGLPRPTWTRRSRTGDYEFICQVHPDTMRGVVHVGTAPAPPVVSRSASRRSTTTTPRSCRPRPA